MHNIKLSTLDLMFHTDLISCFVGFVITTLVTTSLTLLFTLVTSQDRQIENSSANMTKPESTLSEDYSIESTMSDLQNGIVQLTNTANDTHTSFPAHFSAVTETSASEVSRKSIHEEVTIGDTSSPESIKLEPSITHISTLSDRTGDQGTEKTQVYALPGSSEPASRSQPHSFTFSTPYQTMDTFESNLLLKGHESTDSVRFSAESLSTVRGTTSTHLFSRYC